MIKYDQIIAGCSNDFASRSYRAILLRKLSEWGCSINSNTNSIHCAMCLKANVGSLTFAEFGL